MEKYIRYIKRHKRTSAIVAGIVLLLLIVLAINAYQKSTRDYYIRGDETVTLKCNAHVWQDIAKCSPVEFKGTFSNYKDTELRSESSGTITKIDTNNFTAWDDGYISYQYEQFNPSELKNGYKNYITLRLRGGSSFDALATKVVTINYTFDQQDIDLFKKEFTEWKTAREQNQAKEADSRKASEAEQKAAEEKRKAEEAAKKAAEDSKTQPDSQNNYKMPSDISIYDIQALCERHAESKGYPNAEIKTSTMQGKDMEDGNHYWIMGDLYVDEGWTSSERAVGSYACTVDYNQWVVKTAYLNRQDL